MQQVKVTKHEFLAFLSSVGGSATRQELRDYFDITDVLLRKKIERYRSFNLIKTNLHQPGDVCITNNGYKILANYDNGYCPMPMCLCHQSDKEEGQEP